MIIDETDFLRLFRSICSSTQILRIMTTGLNLPTIKNSNFKKESNSP